MERSARPAVDHLKEVAWAVFMLDLIFALLALLCLPHFGTAPTLWVFGILAAITTLTIGGIAVLNVLLVWAFERWERRSRRTREPPGA